MWQRFLHDRTADKIAAVLSQRDAAYEDLVLKFLEHFAGIAEALEMLEVVIERMVDAALFGLAAVGGPAMALIFTFSALCGNACSFHFTSQTSAGASGRCAGISVLATI